jgi:hypothetical protein
MRMGACPRVVTVGARAAARSCRDPRSQFDRKERSATDAQTTDRPCGCAHEFARANVRGRAYAELWLACMT